MLALKLFEKYIPYALPFLLVFFRGLADFTVLLVGLMFLFKSYKETNWTWINETWFKFSLLFVIYLSTFNTFLSINPSDSFLYALTFLRWPIFASALYFWIFKKNSFTVNCWTKRKRMFAITVWIFWHKDSVSYQ